MKFGIIFTNYQRNIDERRKLALHYLKIYISYRILKIENKFVCGF